MTVQHFLYLQFFKNMSSIIPLPNQNSCCVLETTPVTRQFDPLSIIFSYCLWPVRSCLFHRIPLCSMHIHAIITTYIPKSPFPAQSHTSKTKNICVTFQSGAINQTFHWPRPLWLNHSINLSIICSCSLD